MAEEHGELWHVADGGKSYGPYTSDMLETRITQSRFTRAALVWKAGLPSWQPIAFHFPLPEIPAGAVPEAQVLPTPSDRSNRIPIRFWVTLVGVIFFFGLIVSGYSASDEWSAAAFLSGRVGSIAVLLCLALLNAVWWWKWAGSDAASNRSRGLTKLLVVLCTTIVLVAAFIAMVNTPLLYRLQIARQSFNHYSINVDVGTRTLLVQGTIGPGMATEIDRQLEANATIRTVTIDSIGGLLQEALRIARDIQAHNLATQVRHECNSACILVFMAGNHRAAPYNFTFGFHASSSVTPMSGTYNLAALDDEKAGANAYLVARGVPNEFIEGAAKLGPEKLYSVSAIRMADAGLVTELLDKGDTISSGRAKWLAVVNNSKRLQEPEALLKLLSTIEEVDPTAVEKYGPIMWRAAQAGSGGSAASAARKMVAELATKALPAADDESVARVVKVTSAELQYVRSSENWVVCAGLLDGKGFGANTPPTKILDEDFLAAAALIRSGAQNSWNTIGPPPWASQLGADTAKNLAAKMIARGINVQNVDTDPRISCEWSTALFTAISEKPTPVAAGLYRWLAAGAK